SLLDDIKPFIKDYCDASDCRILMLLQQTLTATKPKSVRSGLLVFAPGRTWDGGNKSNNLLTECFFFSSSRDKMLVVFLRFVSLRTPA
ncbi:hypothetical protein, partial [Photobacterium halotolerans]|uniref:hypothetical protein n=1 Tax=Photobacterium halotolerans TaxID=265726 RepID=UPI001F2BA7EC